MFMAHTEAVSLPEEKQWKTQIEKDEEMDGGAITDLKTSESWVSCKKAEKDLDFLSARGGEFAVSYVCLMLNLHNRLPWLQAACSWVKFTSVRALLCSICIMTKIARQKLTIWETGKKTSSFILSEVASNNTCCPSCRTACIADHISVHVCSPWDI